MRAAIVVGCSSYEDEEIANLQFADRDARTLAATLTARCGVEPTDVFLIADGETDWRVPTRSQLFRVLARGSEIARRHHIETLFFVFSGHGWHSSKDGRDYLVLSDTVAGALEETALDFGVLVRLLRSWKADRCVVILDACRSCFDASKAPLDPGERPLFELPEADGMVVLRSCSEGQRSFESASLSQGLFTACLVRALDDENRCATYYEVEGFLRRELPALCLAQDKPVQMPMSTIEPIAVQHALMVSPAQAAAWRQDVRIGRELRRALARDPDGGRWASMMAIDFGTSSTLAAVRSLDTGQPRLLLRDGGLLPSAIHFNADLSYSVGREALNAMERDPPNGRAFFKRFLGSGESFAIHGKSIAPEVAASLIIASIKQDAEEFTGTAMTEVVASYPINFTTVQLNGLIEALQLAGFGSAIRLMPEPCAASLSLGEEIIHPETFTNFLVIDLGGGTFDVAVVSVGHDLVEVLAVDGLRGVGGRDYDERLARVLIDRARAAYPDIATDEHRLLVEAERCKMLLCGSDAAPFVLDLGPDEDGAPRQLSGEVTRSEARAAFRDLDDAVMAVIDSIGNATARLASRGDIHNIVLAGMGARVFTLREMIAERYPDATPFDRHQDNAVARGLGEYLRTLVGGERAYAPLLLDVLGKNIFAAVRDVTASSDRFGLPSASSGLTLHLSSLRGENALDATVMEAWQTIPKRRTFQLRFEGAGEEFEIVLLEAHPSDAGGSPIDTLRITGRPSEATLSLDVDARGLMFVRIEGDGLEYAFQLNHFYATPIDYDVGAPGADAAWRVEAERSRSVVRRRGE